MVHFGWIANANLAKPANLMIHLDAHNQLPAKGVTRSSSRTLRDSWRKPRLLVENIRVAMMMVTKSFLGKYFVKAQGRYNVYSAMI